MPQAIDLKGEHSSWKQIIKKKTKQNVTRRRNLLTVNEGQWEICLRKAQPCWMTGRNTARWSLIDRRQSPGWQETLDIPFQSWHIPLQNWLSPPERRWLLTAAINPRQGQYTHSIQSHPTALSSQNMCAENDSSNPPAVVWWEESLGSNMCDEVLDRSPQNKQEMRWDPWNHKAEDNHVVQLKYL